MLFKSDALITLLGQNGALTGEHLIYLGEDC